MSDAIISIKPRHVQNIIRGIKTVELRTKALSLPLGTKLWIYTTLPVGKIETVAEIEFIKTLSPKEIWELYGKDICISKSEFDDYTRGRHAVTAIGLSQIEELSGELCLKTIRNYEEGFQPPQFFTKIPPNRNLYAALYS